MELKLGKMTNAEMASWFNIGESTFRKQKEKRLETLAQYCKFHLEGTTQKKIVIDEIYEATYEGDKPKAKGRAIEFSVSNWETNGYDTISDVQKKNVKSYRQEGYLTKESTIKTYTYWALKEAIAYSRARSGAGPLGRYEKEWGVENAPGAFEKYRPLSPAEKEIKAAVSREFFSKDENKDELAIACIIQDGRERGLSQKEIDEEIGMWRRIKHEEWKIQVEKALGFRMEIIIKVEWSAFRYEDDK